MCLGISFRSTFRFKIAILLPIKHTIICITVISTWNINTSTNTEIFYHGSKGSWNSLGFLSWHSFKSIPQKSIRDETNVSNFILHTKIIYILWVSTAVSLLYMISQNDFTVLENNLQITNALWWTTRHLFTIWVDILIDVISWLRGNYKSYDWATR